MQSHTDRHLRCFQKLWNDLIWFAIGHHLTHVEPILLAQRVLNGVHFSQDFLRLTAGFVKVVFYRRICLLCVDSIFDKISQLKFGCNLKLYCMSVLMDADDIISTACFLSPTAIAYL